MSTKPSDLDKLKSALQAMLSTHAPKDNNPDAGKARAHAEQLLAGANGRQYVSTPWGLAPAENWAHYLDVTRP